MFRNKEIKAQDFKNLSELAESIKLCLSSAAKNGVDANVIVLHPMYIKYDHALRSKFPQVKIVYPNASLIQVLWLSLTRRLLK